jgi:uncharacterized membrane protein
MTTMASTKDKNKTENVETAQSIDHATERNISKVMEIECAQRQNRTVGERISETIAGFCGSMTFVWVHVAWFSMWVIVNSFPRLKFDPFPYTFLTLVVSLEAIFLSTFILISQNHDTKLTERRNHLDLQINMLAEQESTKTLDLLRRVAEKLGVEADDPETKVLAESMQPEKLVDQIVSASQEVLDKETSNNSIKTGQEKAAT